MKISILNPEEKTDLTIENGIKETELKTNEEVRYLIMSKETLIRLVASLNEGAEVKEEEIYNLYYTNQEENNYSIALNNSLEYGTIDIK